MQTSRSSKSRAMHEGHTKKGRMENPIILINCVKPRKTKEAVLFQRASFIWLSHPFSDAAPLPAVASPAAGKRSS